MRLICDLRTRRGVTSVVVTHDLAAALRTSDRIMLVNNGKSVLCAAPAEFAASKESQAIEFISAMKGEGT